MTGSSQQGLIEEALLRRTFTYAEAEIPALAKVVVARRITLEVCDFPAKLGPHSGLFSQHGEQIAQDDGNGIPAG